MTKQSTEQLKIEEILPDINTKYAYVLAQKNEPRGMVYDENGRKRGEIEYKPYLNLILSSSIIWDGKVDPFSGKPRSAGRHKIRFYDGCTTLFVDDQPKDKETVDELVASTREIIFRFGFCFVYGYDTLLKSYLDWCSYNEESIYRMPTVAVKFKPVDSEKQIRDDEVELELEDAARDLAKSAPLKKMNIHAKYLGISFEDEVTGHPLSDSAMRTEYRKYAKAEPKHFLTSYNDKTIEVTTWVAEALNTGKISTTKVANTAVWAKGQTVICDLSGLKAQDLIIAKLVELTQIESGADFLAQLKTLYS